MSPGTTWKTSNVSVMLKNEKEGERGTERPKCGLTGRFYFATLYTLVSCLGLSFMYVQGLEFSFTTSSSIFFPEDKIILLSYSVKVSVKVT